MAEREHRNADELQQSLLPAPTFELDHLEVATYYRAGVEGTQVGGDWYDVIELGAGRTAFVMGDVMGDVMGRGVRAAAVMGQLRSAIRAYARLDLPPSDVLEFLDGVVRGEDQIVTCIYAIYDPADRTFGYANAGHLPPLLIAPGQPTLRLTGEDAPPLGTGPLELSEAQVHLPLGATVALYTDGLVERRDDDVGTGIDRLLQELGGAAGPIEELPNALVSALVPGEPDDDIAILLARVTDGSRQASSWVHEVVPDLGAVQVLARPPPVPFGAGRCPRMSSTMRCSSPVSSSPMPSSMVGRRSACGCSAPPPRPCWRFMTPPASSPAGCDPHPRTSTGAACSWLPALPTGGGFGPSVRGRLSGAPSRSAATSAATHSSKPSPIRREHAVDPLSALGTRRNGRHRGFLGRGAGFGSTASRPDG